MGSILGKLTYLPVLSQVFDHDCRRYSSMQLARLPPVAAALPAGYR
jgi:hypothetical protein